MQCPATRFEYHLLDCIVMSGGHYHGIHFLPTREIETHNHDQVGQDEYAPLCATLVILFEKRTLGRLTEVVALPFTVHVTEEEDT